MLKSQKMIIGICVVVFAFIFAAAPYLISYSQKKGEPQKQDNARREVAKSVVGSMFLEKITIKEPDWNLKGAHYFGRDERNNSTRISMAFSKGNVSAAFDIVELDSVKEANEMFHGQRSYGANVEFNKFGEKGDMLVHPNGDFIALRFRQGNFFVQIFTPNQKTAELFAGFILESLPPATK